MRAASLVAAFIVAFCSLAFAQTWIEYRPAEGGYRVELPGQPQVSQETVKSDGGPVPTTIASATLGKTMAFVVMHSDYTQKQLAGRSTATILDGARDGALNVQKGRTLRTEQSLTINKHPARRLIIDSEGGQVFVMQIVLAGTRFHQAIFVGTKKGAEDSAEAKRFIGSFAIVGR